MNRSGTRSGAAAGAGHYNWCNCNCVNRSGTRSGAAAGAGQRSGRSATPASHTMGSTPANAYQVNTWLYRSPIQWGGGG